YARHVLAPERRGLADGRHHLHLAELDVRRVGVVAREGPAEGAPRIETEVAAGPRAVPRVHRARGWAHVPGLARTRHGREYVARFPGRRVEHPHAPRLVVARPRHQGVERGYRGAVELDLAGAREGRDELHRGKGQADVEAGDAARHVREDGVDHV